MQPTPLDSGVSQWVQEHRSEPWTTIAEAVTTAGNTVPLVLLAAAIVVALAIKGHRLEAAWLAVTSLAGWLLMVGLKAVFGRTRPPEDQRLLEIDSFAFPSGHAMMTMVVFGSIAVCGYRVSSWLRDHRGVLLLAPLASILVGITRVYLGVHWSTDVLAGWAAGAVWVALCALVLRRLDRPARAAGPQPDR